VCLRLTYPRHAKGLCPPLENISSTHGSQATSSFIHKVVASQSSRNRTVTDFYLNANTFKSCVLNTIVSRQGAHGVYSGIHSWSLEEKGNGVTKRQISNIAVDYRFVLLLLWWQYHHGDIVTMVMLSPWFYCYYGNTVTVVIFMSSMCLYSLLCQN